MRIRGFILLLSLSFFLLSLSACATARWTPNQLTSVQTGQKADSVISRLGQPDSRKIDSNGNQVWEYRNPSESHVLWNSFWAIYSGGHFSGKDAPYVDILTVRLNKKNKVVNTTYAEGQTMLSGYLQQRD
jgi:hypothetical protein